MPGAMEKCHDVKIGKEKNLDTKKMSFASIELHIVSFMARTPLGLSFDSFLNNVAANLFTFLTGAFSKMAGQS